MKPKECNILNHITQQNCTGCGGCKNICPVDAIDLIEDEEHFLFPFIDKNKCVNCGRCITACPAINKPSRNKEICPSPYAIRCGDAIRQVSSSGGVFSVLANHFLVKHGFICGAEFDQNMQLHHSIINTAEALINLRGSKYLQSNTGYIYRIVKEKLDNHYPVLFVGCPCQVAALYNYLSKDYDNLFTIDLICHGVPSQYIFDRYLHEISNGKSVYDVKFRDKRYGWRSTNILIKFANGELYEGDWKDDPFEKGFQHNIFLRRSCENCEFSIFPRQGDLTIGDFWQIEKFDKAQNDGKGTSLVFINNYKGQSLYDILKMDSPQIKKMDIPIEKIPNRLQSHYPSNMGRERFFDLIKSHTVSSSIECIMEQKYDIGLVGIYTVENFGGAITYFALYRAIKKLGYTCLMIERPMNAPHKPSARSVYAVSPFKEYEKAPFYANKQSMRKLNQKCEKFLVGSDQLFNDYLYNNFGQWCTLDWVNDNKIKLAYSASFGHDYIWSSEENRAQMAYFMQKFDRFSVREISGVDIAKQEFGVDATWVLDPVFLCDPQDYVNLAMNKSRVSIDKYIGAYILDPNYEKQQLLEKISSQLNLRVQVFSEMEYHDPHNGWNLPTNTGQIEDYLNNIIYCDYFIADSFHGICFAIIFKKNFIAINNARRGKSRLESVLTLLGLEDRLIDSANDFCEDLLSPIDYTAVNSRLNSERDRCMLWLKESLSLSKKKTYSTYDICNQRIVELENQIDTLLKENQKVISRGNAILNRYDWTYAQIENIYEYFDKLISNKQNLIIIIAVKDTPGFSFDDDLYRKMKELGFSFDLRKKHWFAYAGISIASSTIETFSESGKAQLTKRIKWKYVKIISKSYHEGNVGNIFVNGQNVSVNKRGLNIVAMSKKTMKVLDSVCFDTHDPALTCYR